MSKLLSLCIPTYGVSEWVLPVLDSIYNQNVSDDLFEVVITDNGKNELFENDLLPYMNKHNNLIYKKTDAYSFLNEIESYKVASGDFIKFVNHRTLMVDGSINYLLEFVNKYNGEKPFVYFTQGELKDGKQTILNTFDEFVNKLSYWSSWSTGMAFWKEDFNKVMNLNVSDFNELFPHTNILFCCRNKNKYIVDDKFLLKEMEIEAKRKGKYDLFYAFCVEYPAIILDLLRSNDISIDTFSNVLDSNLDFITTLYFDYVYRKKECSYDVSNYANTIEVFYSDKELKKRFRRLRRKKIINKIF